MLRRFDPLKKRRREALGCGDGLRRAWQGRPHSPPPRQTHLFVSVEKALLFDWGRRHPESVRAVAHMETIVTPLSWSDRPGEIRLDGEPANVAAIVVANERWLEGPEVPKLFVDAEPGSILVGRQREVCRRWANQSEVTVFGVHFAQEDSGEKIGVAIASWLDSL